MNEVFSVERFRRLFVKHTVEHYRAYLMSIAVLAGVLLLGGSFVFYVIPEPPDPAFQSAMYVILMLLSGALFTSTVFADYGDKNKAIPALTLPATALEKFLVGWVYSYPIFLLIYSGVFYFGLYGLSSFRHWEGHQHFYMMHLGQREMIPLFVIFSIVQALTLMGAIFFRKLHFIKTAFAFFITLAVVILLNTLLLRIMTGRPTVKLAIPFGFLNFFIQGRYYSISINNSGSTTIISSILMGVTVLIWVAAYFRLKEKQV